MNLSRTIALTALAALTPLAAAEDEITLEGNQELTGMVVAIGEDGRIVVESELSPDPLAIRGEAATKIRFAATESSAPSHREILHLINGDTLPGEFVALDEKNIGFATPYAGRIDIARRLTRSIDFGITPQRLVFEGPGDLSEWEENDDWKISGSTLTSSSNSTISRSKILPEQFILRFRLEWLGTPSLRFYFCDDVLEANSEADRYYFEFNSGGMQLKREMVQNGRRWHPLVSLPLKPQLFPRSKVDIELRVDRARRIIHVYVNDQSQGFYRDHNLEFPDGTGILIQSLAGGGSRNIISKLEIYEWDAVSQLRGEEGHDDISLDSLISTNGNRFSGVAKEVVAGEKGPEVRFVSPHADDDFLVPRDRISTLYFRVADVAETATPTHLAELLGSGHLHLSQPTLADGVLRGIHPLLGEVALDSSAVMVLDRLNPEED